MSSTRRNNIYKDPAISRVFGSLANILTGSAADDANIARGKYYDSQTVGQNQKNKNASGLSETINTLTNSDLGRSIAANMLGGNVDGSGNLVKKMPSSVRQSVPLYGNQVNMNQDDINAQLSNLGKTIYGDQTYSPNQITSAYNNIQAGGNSSLANNMMRYGDQDEQQRGFKMSGKNPSKYFNQNIAREELANDLSGTLDKNNKNLQASQYNTDQDNITKKEDLRQKRIITKELGIAKIESVAETAKYKFDNREITIAVSKDQKVYIDQTTADTLGVEPTIENGEEVYVINGKASPNKVDQVKVQVGKADVYLSKEMADELGIPVNDQGQYIIKGSGFKDSTSNKNNGGLKQKDVNDSQKYFENAYKAYEQYNELPSNVIGNIQQIIYKNIAEDLKEKVARDQAFSSNVEGVVSQGVVQITNPFVGEDLVAPKYFVDYFQKNADGKKAPLETVVKFFGSLGYDDNDSKAIANFIKG